MLLLYNRIYLFNSFTCSVEEIAKFHNYYWSYQVATTQNKVNSYVRYFEYFLKLQIFAIDGRKKSFEIFDLNTRQITRGLINNPWMIDSKNFTGPDPPEWRVDASVAYFKDKLYYLSGDDPKAWIWKNTSRVDVRRSDEKSMI